ncbi:hypothetical protein HYT18_04475 [Candidatus Microgenomates bacterium]|nr:hypothetical protein [Candidatus Microgenomates bacterium]
MAYRYRSRRSTRKLARKSKRNFILTLILVIFLIYATISWILPFFINALGYINSLVKPPAKLVLESSENASLAPPVFNIPYEATNSPQINIQGYASPNILVRLYLDEGSTKEVNAQSDGSFLIENVELALGTNNIWGKTVDEKGKESLSSKTIKIIFDNEKPLLEVTEPEDGKQISGERRLKLTGKTEAEAKVFINDSRVIVDKDGNFSTDQSLNDGENIFTIKAIDQASNSSEIVRRVIFTP